MESDNGNFSREEYAELWHKYNRLQEKREEKAEYQSKIKPKQVIEIAKELGYDIDLYNAKEILRACLNNLTFWKEAIEYKLKQEYRNE